MNLQGRDLSANLVGEDVALLQSELRQLGFLIDVAEAQRKFFGRTTEAAVRTFQRKTGLKVTGVIDATTATRINQQVDAKSPRPAPATPVPPVVTAPVVAPPSAPQAPDVSAPPPLPPAASGRLTIVGHVRSEAGEAQPDITVRAVRLLLRAKTKTVGSAKTDAEGFYRIACEMISTASPTRVDAFNGRKGVAQSELTCERSGEVTLDLTIPDGKLSGPTEYSRLVRLLAPFLEGLRPEQLTDADIEILRCAANVSRDRLLALRLASVVCVQHEALT